MKVSLVQMNAIDNKQVNLKVVNKLIRKIVAVESPRLVVLPECFDFHGGTTETATAEAECFPDGQSYNFLSSIAKELGIYLHAGSIIEKFDGKIYNSTVVFDPLGSEVARYRKIHLFDIETPDGVIYKESDTYDRGDQIITYEIDGVRFGCTICYDIRFPELYAELVKKGAEVIVIPAAFTKQTGEAHWELLCRARAIETQTYVLACGTTGTHVEDGEDRYTYGNSMIVDPWGKILIRADHEVCTVTSTIDLNYVSEVREKLPAINHHVL
ncbi:MAG: carbon-nitrogen hydrolase family protein [Emcibacteraceae bacterium]|nr:carbon-nitrogen hydrolase family protein [Emcibacteraceae bacterium]